MPVEYHLLFAVLAFEDELIDLEQLTAACRAWAADKSRPIADLLTSRGWVSTEDRHFLEKKAERKIAKHQDDPKATLNAVTRGDVSTILRGKVNDVEVQQSLTDWPSDAPVRIEAIGETIDESHAEKTRYTWINEVGEGGLGKVWLARDNDLSREVALKEIKPGTKARGALRRLIKEAQITGQLQHPGIVPVYEVNHDGRPFYTMKLVKGETLSRVIRNHHEEKQAGQECELSERRLLNIFLNICEAIAYAHSRGVIHRDLKPENIILGEYGEAIVLDWGLARQVGTDDEDSAPIVVTETGRTDATLAGQQIGTPAYMAPEQAAGRVDHMDQRTDIYGLGAILFEILTGRAPHKRDSHSSNSSGLTALLHRIATDESPKVRSIDETIPGELEVICATAMHRYRDNRYQTAKELKAALLLYQVHEESIELTARADTDLTDARQSGQYDDFSRARFGFTTALQQWPENQRAADGLKEAQQDYARAAFERGDYDLALSLLDESDSVHLSLLAMVRAAAAERVSRFDRIRRLRRFGIAASLTIAILASVGVVWINLERNKALTAQKEEAVQREVAEQNLKASERSAYRSDMLLAQREWESNHIGHLRELLDRHRDRDDLKGFEWEFWDRMVNADLQTINGRTRFVRGLSVSPDGKRIASGGGRLGQPEDLRVWDAETGRQIFALKGHTGLVWSLSFNRDGTRIVSGSEDGTARLWDAETGHELLVLTGHSGSVRSAGFSPDGARIITSSSDKTIKVWDTDTGQERLTLDGHWNTVESAVFSPDGTRIASGGIDKSVRIWNAETGQEIHALKGHSGPVWKVSFNADGTRIASGSVDKSIRLWNTESGREELIFTEHSGIVLTVGFSPDGMWIVSGSTDKTVKLWNATTGEGTLTFKGHSEYVTGACFTPDGTRIVSGSGDGTIKIWDAETAPETLTFDGHSKWISDVGFSPNGTQIASGSGDKTVKIRDAETGMESLTLKGHSGPVRSAKFSSDGKWMVTGGGVQNEPGEVKVWNTETGEEKLAINGHSDFVWSVSFTPDGTRIVSGSGDGTAKVWSVETGRELLSFDGHSKSVVSVSVSPDGMRIASGSDDNTIKVWDTESGQEILTLEGHSGTVNCVSFSLDGTRILSSSVDETARVWNAETGQEVAILKGHSEAVLNADFSPDGTRIVSCGRDRTVKVWDASTGEETITLFGNSTFVSSVAFSPDGKRIVSGGGDATLKVWDARRWSKN